MRKYIFLKWCFGILFLFNFNLFAQKRYAFQRYLMGSEFNIVFYAANDSIAKVASDSVFRRIEFLNTVLSDYLDGSEANQLSALAGSEKWQKVSPEMFEVLSNSIAISQKTNGAFDVSIGAITQLWRRAIRRNFFPETAEIEKNKTTVGYNFIQLNAKNRSVKLLKTGTRLDFGGIGKGYAADEGIRVLKHFKIVRALIDAGGDLAIAQPPPNKPLGWAIEISSGLKDPTKMQTIFLKNCGVATSGKTYRYIDHNGKRYSHIVNPKTGVGLLNHVRTTVVAENGTVADALATAFSVLGIEKSKKIVKKFKPIKVWLLEQNKEWKMEFD